jgi:hypothetical protein
MSGRLAASEAYGSEAGRQQYPPMGSGNTFSFKLEDRKGRVHRFNCGEFLELIWFVIRSAELRCRVIINFYSYLQLMKINSLFEYFATWSHL